MLNRDDVIDVLMDALAPAKAPGAPAKAKFIPNAPRGRPFLSEYDIKKRLTPGAARLTLAKEFLISPLALEWLALRGIELVRE